MTNASDEKKEKEKNSKKRTYTEVKNTIIKSSISWCLKASAGYTSAVSTLKALM